MKQVKNIVLGMAATAFLAVLFADCQKKGSAPNEDKSIRLVKTYFLKGTDRAAVEQSFRLCGTENGKAIDNLNRIYNSNNPKNTINQIVDEMMARYKARNPDGFAESVQPKIADLQSVFDEKSITNKEIAYQYALTQHRIYLDNPQETLDSGTIQNLYVHVKAGQPDDCLGKKQTAGNDNKTNPRPETQNEPAAGPGEDDKKQPGFITGLLLVALFTLFYLERNNKYKHVKWLGRALFGLAKKSPSAKPYKPGYSPQSDMLKQKSAPPDNAAFNPYGPPHWSPSDYRPIEKTAPEVQNTTAQQMPTEPEQPPMPPKQPEAQKPPAIPEAWKIPPPIMPPPAEQPPPETEPKQPEAVASPGVLYARMPSGNLFFNLSPIPNYPDTPFIITQNGDTGEFTLATDPDTLERLFSMIDQLKDACELLNVNAPDPKGHFDIAKGKVVREGEYWKITEKIKMNW